ncbi:LysR family transcriptional regulator [Roseovarius sp. SCSIO 43702]|uniref:LysR family transcriptional regulator n=1 Tax=Roseovarius sp. SCSIO 43702 TaxID=2823043 RepID=UPI001C73D9AF|nr:LysR family transcriptional regulator [Roseovarius sp. SCSIO 43702]QYX57424.1 LysR family transcriptional regulator [Roseovarius sp. SCSIO 43702]
MADFTLKQLEYLLACVDEGSVAGAAARLNVSQPTISVAIAKLEARLGVQLLLRHHAQGVTLTGAGADLVPMARNLVAQAEDLGRAAQEAGQGVRGRLRVGALSTLAPKVLPRVIRVMGERHPGVAVDIREGGQAEILRSLYAGRLDLAVLYDIDLPPDLALETMPAQSPYVALPEGHRLAEREEIALEDLVDEPLILLDMPPSRDFFLNFFRARGLEPRIAQTSPSMEVVRGLVAQGLGYSILVTRPAGDLSYDGRRLIIRALRDCPTQSAIVIARPGGLRETRAMAAFTEIAGEHLR